MHAKLQAEEDDRKKSRQALVKSLDPHLEVSFRDGLLLELEGYVVQVLLFVF